MAIIRRSDFKRGRAATGPHRMPARGWLDVFRRVAGEIVADRIVMVSAAVAFWAMLSIFPAIFAAVAVYGLVFDVQAIEGQLTELASYLPASAADLMGEQLRRLVASSADELGLRVVFGLLVALWTASTGTASLLEAVNLAYDEEEERSYVQLRLQALRITLGGLLGGATLLAVLMGISWLLGDRAIAMALRWLCLFLAAITGLAVLYRFAPEREPARWRWLAPGAAIATLLWLAASAAFAFYVRSVGDYEATYGALGGAIVLMLWLFATVFAILIGAEINAELESQIARDSTTGPAKPIGARGAVKADELSTT